MIGSRSRPFLALASTVLVAVFATATESAAQGNRAVQTRVRIDTACSHPDHGGNVKSRGTLGTFVGTRGRSMDLTRLRFSGDLPAGVELRGVFHWGDAGSSELDWSAWLEPIPADPDATVWLHAMRLHLAGPNADAWDLRYRAHVGYLGDSPWETGGALVGVRGHPKYKLQGLELTLTPREAGDRQLAVRLALPADQPQRILDATAPNPVGHLSAVVVEAAADRVRVHPPRRLGEPRAMPLRWYAEKQILAEPALLEHTLRPGGSATFHVVILSDAVGESTPRPPRIDELLTDVLPAQPGDGLVGGNGFELPGDHVVLGAFSVLLHTSESGSVRTMFAGIRGLASGGRIRQNDTSRHVAGERAALVELRRDDGLPLDVVAYVVDR